MGYNQAILVPIQKALRRHSVSLEAPYPRQLGLGLSRGARLASAKPPSPATEFSRQRASIRRLLENTALATPILRALYCLATWADVLVINCEKKGGNRRIQGEQTAAKEKTSFS